MSIKSLFEDIADAIREKSGSSDTYTPAEMPSAIRSIPSGSSTASGVSYDNTSSGLTASNVQDAIDELSGDVSTINSDLSELKPSYVETVADGIKTYKQLFNVLFTSANAQKVTKNSCVVIESSSETDYYLIKMKQSTRYLFESSGIASATSLQSTQIGLMETNSYYQMYANGNPGVTDYTNTVCASGTKLRLEY